MFMKMACVVAELVIERHVQVFGRSSGFRYWRKAK